MSSDNQALHHLLDSSCEEMLLYFQEVTYHLARDGKNLEDKLESLFAEAGLTTADQYQPEMEATEEGKIKLAAVKKKLNNWKEKAKATSEYKELSRKYGSDAAEKLLGISVRFDGNPAGIGADDYPKIMKHVYNGHLAFHQILRVKYPKIAAVVQEIQSTCGNDTGRARFSRTSHSVVNEKGDVHLQKATLLARYTSFLTSKDRESAEESSYYNVMEAQFSMVFTYFLVFSPDLASETQERELKESKKPGRGATSLENIATRRVESVLDEKKKALQQVGIVLEDIARGVKDLIAEKKEMLRNMNALQDPEAYNKIAVELAVLEGERSFEVIVDGKKTKQKVSSFVGFNTRNISTLGRLRIIDYIEAVDDIENLKDPKDPKKYNQLALELAVLEGKKEFETVIDEKKKKQEVSSIIGFDTTKLSALQRLEKTDNVEVLKAAHATALGLDAVKDLSERIAKLGDFDAEKNPKKAKKYRALSEARAILNRAPEYQLQPRPNCKGELVLVNTLPESTVDLLHVQAAERLELYRQYCKENKKFFPEDGKPNAKLIRFLETIRHFVNDFSEMLKKPKIREAASEDTIRLNNNEQKRSPVVLKISGIVGTLFQQKLLSNAVTIAAATEEVTRTVAPIVPRIPGTRGTPAA